MLLVARGKTLISTVVLLATLMTFTEFQTNER